MVHVAVDTVSPRRSPRLRRHTPSWKRRRRPSILRGALLCSLVLHGAAMTVPILRAEPRLAAVTVFLPVSPPPPSITARVPPRKVAVRARESRPVAAALPAPAPSPGVTAEPATAATAAMEESAGHAEPVASDPDVAVMPEVAITRPVDGLRLGEDDPPLVPVEGRLRDRSAPSVWLVVNGRRIRIAARDGAFRSVLPILERDVTVWAESAPDGERARRSAPVRIHAHPNVESAAVVAMDVPGAIPAAAIEIEAAWRERPDRPDGPAQRVRWRAFENGAAADLPRMFYLPRLHTTGVYTFVLDSAAPEIRVRPTLYLSRPVRSGPIELRPVSADGTGRAVLARVLLPQGVLWDEDDWFSGQSRNGETVTKFRFPEAVSWTERIRDAR